MKCPKCGKEAHYRHGRAFEHELRCDDCGFIWEENDPNTHRLANLARDRIGEIALAKAENERLKGVIEKLPMYMDTGGPIAPGMYVFIAPSGRLLYSKDKYRVMSVDDRDADSMGYVMVHVERRNGWQDEEVSAQHCWTSKKAYRAARAVQEVDDG